MASHGHSRSMSSVSSTSIGSGSPATTVNHGSEHGDHVQHAGHFNVDSVLSSLPSADSERFILVVGGLGFIGSHTALELLKAGYNVIIVDNMSNSYSSVFPRVKLLAAEYCKAQRRQMPALHFHKLDYQSEAMKFLLESYSEMVTAPSEDPEKQSQVTYRSRISGVIHFAAYKSVSESIEKPIEYYENNICGLVTLVGMLARFNIYNFVFSSSATVYGTKADEGRLLREEDIVHHEETYVNDAGETVTATPNIAGLTCPYARTKFFGEAILADIALSDPKWRIIALRYFNPVGCDSSGLLGESPRQKPTNLFPVITQVLTGDRANLDVFGNDWDTTDGTAIRDFIHVSDVARGHVAAVNAHSEATFRTYNLGSGTGTTVVQAVESLKKAAGKPIPLNWAPRRAGDVGFCVASKDRAQKELGWSSRESIDKCASDLWNYVSKFNKAEATA